MNELTILKKYPADVLFNSSCGSKNKNIPFNSSFPKILGSKSSSSSSLTFYSSKCKDYIIKVLLVASLLSSSSTFPSS